MPPFRTILHPSDFSGRSRHALEVACSLARGSDARLIVLHVLRPAALVHGQPADPRVHESQRRFSESVLQRIACPPGVAVEHRLEEGDPAEVILRVAAEAAADLIVMGTHGRTGLTRLLVGSVAEHVMRHAGCPVLTVKAPASPDEPGPADPAPAVAG